MTDPILAAVLRVQDEVGEVKAQIVALTLQTESVARQVAIQNGSVRDINEWRALQERRQEHAAGVAEGRILVRAEDRARAMLVWRLLQSEWIRLGLIVGGVGAILRWFPW